MTVATVARITRTPLALLDGGEKAKRLPKGDCAKQKKEQSESISVVLASEFELFTVPLRVMLFIRCPLRSATDNWRAYHPFTDSFDYRNHRIFRQSFSKAVIVPDTGQSRLWQAGDAERRPFKKRVFRFWAAWQCIYMTSNTLSLLQCRTELCQAWRNSRAVQGRFFVIWGSLKEKIDYPIVS